MKMWSGRFRQPLNPAFEKWQRSLPFDCRLLAEEIAASTAYANGLCKVGVLSAGELKEIKSGLKQILADAAAGPSFLQDEEAEDVHHFVEKHLVAIIGETGNKLHSGRSRNEQVATDLRLYVRSRIDQLQRLLADCVEAFWRRAQHTGKTAMPSYTHLQKAEPVLAAHWLLAYVEMLIRDSERLADCRKRTNLCPLGSGAVAGTTLPLDRHSLAEELGFDGITANSVDASCDRDFAIEFVNALALLAAHLSRWAEEMILFSTNEFGFVRLPEPYSTGSSAMPQKKNPDLLELVRGKAARIMGHSTALFGTLKGLPLAYNKDLQETQEPVLDSGDTLVSMIPLVTGWMKDAEFDYARMEAATQTGFMNAFAAATYLVNRGIPFRRAHEITGKAVQLAIQNDCELADLRLADLQQLSPAFAEDFYSHLTTDAVLAIHDVPGGTARSRVEAALKETERKIIAWKGDIHAHA